ncbi:MAG TPA: NADH-quinone oxidoreductase subunit J [Ktedonobacteraceae bacterium]|nr:NADH-quinone oxidoreductase subunit J [Ktedonobacteraceae bacterium]
MATLLFWVVAVVLVGAALMVVGARKIVHSALALVVVFAMAAGVYLLLDAEFIAIVQILIYAGAVTILILFALMLTRVENKDQITNPNSKTWWAALIISALVCLGVIVASTFTHSTVLAGTAASLPAYGTQACALPPDNVSYIGQLLYSPGCYSYVLPFEIASLVLLVAIVGAIVIGRED